MQLMAALQVSLAGCDFPISVLESPNVQVKQFLGSHTTVYGSVEFVRDNPGEPVPEETFTQFLGYRVPTSVGAKGDTGNFSSLEQHSDG